MKRFLTLSVAAAMAMSASAGNKERIGQAGANELLINPWSRSAGMAGANSTTISGVESFQFNISGLSSVRGTELNFASSQLYSGSGISLNSIGLGQRVGDAGVMGLCVTTMQFGAIDVTTTNNPDGGVGTYSPQILNIAMAYTRTFSDAIQGGGAVRIISESINNLSTQGVALDAGIRYVTGSRDQTRFGIALRNVGPKMRYQGDGLATTVVLQGSEFTVNQRAEGFEMPALLNIGVSHELIFGSTEGDIASDTMKADYRLTLAGTFTSNSFSPDQMRFGAEFGFKRYFAVRAGLVYENSLFNSISEGRVNANTGPTMGFSAMLPISKKNKNNGFRLDYALQLAAPLGNTHTVGLQLTI